MSDHPHPFTAELLSSLGVVIEEGHRMEDIVRDSRGAIGDDDRRELRRRLAVLLNEATTMMEWLSEQRLENPKM